MKLPSALLALTFAVASSLSLSAYSATDGDKAAVAKPMKPHSHMQEKTGIAPPEKAAATSAEDNSADKSKVRKDKPRHLHPRDGK